jgi:hypothetical protein
MTDTPTPEAVEPMTERDIAPLRAKTTHQQTPHHVTVSVQIKDMRRLFAQVDHLRARALPAPRRYTGGPLEDGLYLWRPALWGAGLRDWASIDTSTLTGRYDIKEIVEAEAAIWLIGPIPIPDLPDEEAANG